MPISAEQWRVKTGMINGSRGFRHHSIKPPQSLCDFPIPSPPPSDWKGYSLALTLLCLPLLYKIYALGAAVTMYLVRGETDYGLVAQNSYHGMMDTHLHHGHWSGILLLLLSIASYLTMTLAAFLTSVHEYRERNKHQLVLIHPLHHLCWFNDGAGGCLQMVPKIVNGCVYATLVMDPQSTLQCVHTSVKTVNRKATGISVTFVSFVLQLSTIALAMLLLLCGDVERNPGPSLGLDDIMTLVNDLKPAESKYYNIGLQLGVKPEKIETIEQDYSHSERRLVEILLFWLRGNTDVKVCWESIVIALKKVDRRTLAEKLMEKYCPNQKEMLFGSEAMCTGSDHVTHTTQQHGCKLSIPVLDTSLLDDAQKQRCQKLSEEMDKISERFQDLIDSISASLEEREIPVKKIVAKIIAFQAFEPVYATGDSRSILKHRMTDLTNAKSIDEVMIIIGDYSSSFNYHLVERIIKSLGTDEDKRKLLDYKEEFRLFAECMTFECPTRFQRPADEQTQGQFMVKVDDTFENCTFSHFKRFVSKLSEVLKLSEGTLALESIRRGCLELTLQAPLFVYQSIFPLSSDQERALDALGVIKILAGDHQYPHSQDEGDSDDNDCGKPDDGSGWLSDSGVESLTSILSELSESDEVENLASCEVLSERVENDLKLESYDPYNGDYRQSRKPATQNKGITAIHNESFQGNQQRHVVLSSASCEVFSERIKNELKLEIIQQDLTRDNYKVKMNNLICWEERSHILTLQSKCNGKYSLVVHQGGLGMQPTWIKPTNLGCYPSHFGYLQGISPDQFAYASQASEAVYIVNAHKKIEVRADILGVNFKHTTDKMYIAFQHEGFQTLCHMFPQLTHGKNVIRVTVEFEVNHWYFNNLIKAVNGISQDVVNKLMPLERDFVQPTHPKDFPQTDQIQYHLQKLDREGQLAAMKSIVFCKNDAPVILLRGSFGTGKTHVLALAAYLFTELGKMKGQTARVLICAHHQHSADRLFNSYFGPMISDRKFPWENVVLVRLSNRKRVDSQYRRYYMSFKQLCEFAASYDLKNSSVVVVSTFLTSLNFRDSKLFPHGFFTHVLIDEGGQAREPETLAPLCLATKDTKVVIAGDSCQVGPAILVLGYEARKNGLKLSLLDRLRIIYHKYGRMAQPYVVTLLKNYRCHESILAVPNQLFYRSQLIPNTILQDAVSHYPLFFVCSSLKPTQPEPEMEAQILLRQVAHWLRQVQRINICDISIVTTTRTQLDVTRNLAQKSGGLHNTKMLTTYTIQGEEFQAVFWSTTEPLTADGNTWNPTISPCDRYVFNTVLTRAKSLVVVVGSPLVLLETEKHMVKLYGEQGKCWSLYIRKCIEHNTLIIPGLVETSMEVKNEFTRRLKRVVDSYWIEPQSSACLPSVQAPLNDQTIQGHHQAPPKESKPKRKGNVGRREASSSSHSQGASFTKDDFPTLTATAAVKDKVPKYTPTPKLPVVHSDYYQEHKDKLSESLLEEELTRDNYKEKFHQLLCWEEMAHEELLEERCDGEYEVTFYQKGYVPDDLEHWNEEYNSDYVRYGHIFTDDADTLAYAKQASESSSIIFEDKNIVIKVKHVFARPPKKIHSNFNAIVFALTQAEVRKLQLVAKNIITQRLPVRFDLKHSYFHGLHETLNRLPEAVVERLVPSKCSFSCCTVDELKHHVPPWPGLLDLDCGQLQALSTVMQCSPEVPVLLAGPFGTGKTRLLARAAYEILKESKQHRVLICAHHQVSADIFVDYFGKMKYNEDYRWFVNFVRVTPSGSYSSQIKRRYPEFYKTKHSVPLLFKYRLVVTTFGTAPSLVKKLKNHPAEGFFTHILIDEGAQTREPEALGPLCFAGKDTKIVIAGDHCQVGPQLLVLGKKAQKRGLQISILERLHNLYESLGDVAEGYSASLMTNHRCHSGILMLPSSLFYESTLQCRVDGTIPHPSVTFPLQFYCPAASFRNVSHHPENTDVEEAHALLDVVMEFCSEWPEQDWGKLKENLNRLCIMSPSANQCSLIWKLIRDKRYHYQSLNGIEVLKAYEIQGREFRAIFIGTSETTGDEISGKIMNPTKSVCDPYVFNTAITRSQSLVVAVGNPFLLLSIEEWMVGEYRAKTGSGDKARCWSQYIKQCLESNTLHILKPQKKDDHPDVPVLKDLLLKKVFSDSFKLEELTSTAKTDSILKAYSKTFESIPACQNLKLTLSRVNNANIAWKFDTPPSNNNRSTNSTTSDETTDETESETIEEFDESYQCILNFVDLREVSATPLDSSKSVVTIKGSKNRIGAFDGDTVQVGVFKDCPEGKHYGRVLINPQQPIINDRQGNDGNFLCRVFHKNPVVFCPVDRKNPNFVNLPRLSRDMLTKRKKETISEELQSKDVVVFNPKSIKAIRNGELPQIQNMIPLSVAKNMLFIVSFIQWNTKYRSPLGMVICAIPKGTTEFRAERLLKLQHKVQYNDESTDYLPATDTQRDPTTGPLVDRVFTIDPDEAQNLDDALSLKRFPERDDGLEMFELGVHIVNVAKHLSHDSQEDKKARQMATTVYGGSKGKIMHMVSMETRRKLSLIPNCIRDVVSVVANVTIVGESFHIEEPKVKMSQIKSTVQLTYGNAQEIMDGKTITKDTKPQDGVQKYNSNKEQPSLSETLQLLYKIAFCMKRERLETDAAYCYDINEPKDAHCWQTHMLVEELMIWANSTVAKRVHECFPDFALLRCQGPPNEEAMMSFVSRNRQLLSHSLCLSHYKTLCANEEDGQSLDLVIPRTTLANLQTATSTNELVFLVSLITSDRYYPQLAAAQCELKSTFQRPEYSCTDSQNDPSKYHHFSLCLDEYTHFTSPVRRYCDVIVQRMVVQQLSSGTLSFKKEELRQLCHSLNSKDKNAKHFEKTMSNVRLAVKFSSSSEVFDAFISKVEKGSVELFFPSLELNSLPQREKKIRVRHLGSFNKQTGDIEQTSKPAQLYHWKVKMTSMNDEQGTHVLHQMNKCLQVQKLPGGQRENDFNITLEVLCLNDESTNDDKSTCTPDDDKPQTMSKEYYSAPLNTSMVKVSPEQWSKALEFVKNPTESKMANFKADLPNLSSDSRDLTTKCPFNGNSPFLNFMLKLSLEENSSLKVWMTWALREAHITPTVQLVELSPAVRICVQHNSHPAECFSDQDLSKASQKHYQNIQEYVKLWERVLLAEAAEKSVKEFQPVIIQDVRLEWPNLSIPSNCIDEVYYTIEDRPGMTIEQQSVVMKQSNSFVENCSEFFKINEGDLVCVRYGTDPHAKTRGVFHLVVQSVDEKEEDGTTIYMKFIGDRNCWISERLVKEKVLIEQTCELQLISLAVSYQQVYKGLLKLNKTRSTANHRFERKQRAISELVTQVALGKKEKQLKRSKVPVGFSAAAMKVFNEDSLATTLWGPTGKQLNQGQREAIQLALQQKFQLIQGPPGTGKSETGAHIAYIFAMANKKLSIQHCVLYCGPSNKSVDVVLRKLDTLCKSNPGLNLRILRIYSRFVEKMDTSPQTNQVLSTGSVTDYSVEKDLTKYSLHEMLRECKDSISEVEKLKMLEKELKQVYKKGEIPSGKLCIAHRKALIKAEEAFLKKQRFDIVLCTCSEAANTRMEYISPRQCIINESGMTTEPESMVPISHCEHVVLIGDHKQLQPVIDYNPAMENGLTTSLFERYAERSEGFTKTLTNQYRMHEAICEFPSNHFYDGKLKADDTVKKRICYESKLDGFWPQGPSYPILFCDVIGEEKQTVGTESKSNRKEAEKVVEIVRVLHHVHKVDLNQLAVLTPYKAQKEEIKREMIKHQEMVDPGTSSGDKKSAVKVASITESQGDEYGIVVLSTVRSQPLAEIAHPNHIQPDHGWLMEHLGFITDKHQINVGITRSKYGLVIVGNKMLLMYDDTWKELIYQYEKKGCVHGFLKAVP